MRSADGAGANAPRELTSCIQCPKCNLSKIEAHKDGELLAKFRPVHHAVSACRASSSKVLFVSQFAELWVTEKGLTCESCGETSVDSKSLMDHSLTCKKAQEIPCPDCQQSISTGECKEHGTKCLSVRLHAVNFIECP